MYKRPSLQRLFTKMPALMSVSYFHIKTILKTQMPQQLQALGAVTLHMLNEFRKPLSSQKMMGERASHQRSVPSQEGAEVCRNTRSGFLCCTVSGYCPGPGGGTHEGHSWHGHPHGHACPLPRDTGLVARDLPLEKRTRPGFLCSKCEE